MTVSRPKVKQIRKVMATVYLEYVVMRWKIFLAPIMASTMVDSPGLVSTMSAAPRAASVAPVQKGCQHGGYRSVAMCRR